MHSYYSIQFRNEDKDFVEDEIIDYAKGLLTNGSYYEGNCSISFDDDTEGSDGFSDNYECTIYRNEEGHAEYIGRWELTN